MKKLIFGLLAIACAGCNSHEAKNMHFGPGPDDKVEESIEECSSCGRVHK